VYTNYARSHIMPGFELGFMCVIFYILRDCLDCNMGAMTWGTWLVSASLIFSPFWFNPLTFSTTKVRNHKSSDDGDRPASTHPSFGRSVPRPAPFH